MTNTTNENTEPQYIFGLADELAIAVGDWVSITQGGRTVQGEVTDISMDGDAVELNGAIGLLFDLEGADVSIA